MLRSRLVCGAVLLCGALCIGALPPVAAASSHRHAHPTPTPTPNPPVVITFQIIPAARGAAVLRSIYPNARITIDAHANAVIVVASGYDEQGMRTIASGIDTKNPTSTAVNTYQLKVLKPQSAVGSLLRPRHTARAQSVSKVNFAHGLLTDLVRLSAEMGRELLLDAPPGT